MNGRSLLSFSFPGKINTSKKRERKEEILENKIAPKTGIHTLPPLGDQVPTDCLQATEDKRSGHTGQYQPQNRDRSASQRQQDHGGPCRQAQAGLQANGKRVRSTD